MTKVLPLECKNCGATYSHVCVGVEPDNAEYMESDVCCACSDRTAPRNAIVRYFDDKESLIEEKEFKGAEE